MPNDLARLQRQPREIARWQKAQQQLMSGRYASALSAYHDLLKSFPGVAQLWFECGMAEGRDLNFDQADATLQRAAEIGAGDSCWEARLDEDVTGLLGQRGTACPEIPEGRHLFVTEELRMSPVCNMTETRLSQTGLMV